MKSGYEMSSKTDEAESGSGVQAHRSKSSGLLAKIVIVLLSVLLIVAVALFVAFVVLYATKSSTSSSSSPPANSSTSPSSANSSDVCQSEACFDLAVQIKGAMDESVDPCEDFYNFTCGHWAAFNHIPEGDTSLGVGCMVIWFCYLIFSSSFVRVFHRLPRTDIYVHNASITHSAKKALLVYNRSLDNAT